MSTPNLIPHATFRCQAQVQEAGRVELTVPLAAGAKVMVYVIEEPADLTDDLMIASQSSLDFWNNPLDDEDWNDA